MTEIAMAETVTVAVPPARRARRLAAVAAVVVALTVGVTLAETLGDHAVGLGPTAFAITAQPHGRVAIRVVSTKASGQQMTNQLHANGLDITVNTVPAAPALVGTWVEIGASADVSQSLFADLGHQALGHVVTIVLPAHFTGSLTFTIARSPEPGEAPVVGGVRNALAPGAPLACKGLSGATPAAAAATLASLGYTITGWTDGAGPGDQGLVPQPPPATRVTEAFIDNLSDTDASVTVPARGHDVIVQVTSPTDSTYGPRLHSGFAPSQPLDTC